MQRLKVEGYIYDICRETEKGYDKIGEIVSDKKLTVRTAKSLIAEQKNKDGSGMYPETAVAVLRGKKTQLYEVSDEQFWSIAKPVITVEASTKETK